MRRAIELGNGNDIAAGVGDVDKSEMQRRLAGCDRKRADAAFEFGHALLEHGGRRVGNAAVTKALGLQVEEGGAVIGELIASQHGLGAALNNDAQAFATADEFAILLVLIVLALVLNGIFTFFENRTASWR